MQEQPSQYPQNYQPQPQYNQQYPPQQPYYPPPQPPQKKSHKGLWITLGIIAAVLVFGCVGISAIIANSAKGVVSTLGTAAATTGTSSSTTAKVGQTITLDGVQATLTSVKIHAGTDFDKPKAGNEYVIVHVKIHNTSSTEHSYNAFEFHVKSGAGNITNEEIVTFANSSDALNSGTLTAGGTAEGDLVFQVKKGDHKAELTWQPSFFGQQGENGWLLGL